MTNERKEIVETLCSLFGVNPTAINVNEYSNTTKKSDDGEIHKVHLSASISDKEEVEDKNKNDNKKFEELKKAGSDLINSINNLKGQIEEKIKDADLDKKIETVADYAESKGLNLAQGLANLLGELSEAVQNEVDKRDPNIKKVEVCDEEVDEREEPYEDTEVGEEEDEDEYLVDGEPEDCDEEEYDEEEAEDEKDCENCPHAEDCASAPHERITAKDIRAKLKACNEDKREPKFYDIVSEMTGGYIDFCIDEEAYDSVSEDLDSDDSGIFFLLTKGDLHSMLASASEYAKFDYKKEAPYFDEDDLKNIMLVATEWAAEAHEFDGCDVEFLTKNVMSEVTEKTKDLPAVKFTLWFGED